MESIIEKKNGNIVKITSKACDINTEGVKTKIRFNDEEKEYFSNYTEHEYHKKKRIDAIRHGETILGGDIIESTTIYKINDFKKSSINTNFKITFEKDVYSIRKDNNSCILYRNDVPIANNIYPANLLNTLKNLINNTINNKYYGRN